MQMTYVTHKSSIRCSILIGLCGLNLMGVKFADAATKCDQIYIENNIQAIQKSQKINLGQSLENLKCGTIASADRLYFWLAYYQKVVDRGVSLSSIKNAYLARVRGSSKKDPLYGARMGDHKSLYQRLQGGDVGVAKSPQVHLGLARALAKSGENQKAVQIYDSHLALARTSPQAELEKLYLLISANELSSAESYRKRLASHKNSKPMEESLKSAEMVIRRLGSSSGTSLAFGSGGKEVLNPGDVYARYHNKRDNLDSVRTMFNTSWTGKYLKAYVDHYEKEVDLLRETHSGSEFGAGFHMEKQGLKLFAGLGFFSESEEPLTFKGDVQYEKDHVIIEAEASRRPLIAKWITNEDGLETLSDEFTGLVNVYGVYAKAQVTQDGDEESWNDISVGYRGTLSKGPKPEEYTSITMALGQESRSKQSALHETFKNVIRIEAVYEWVKHTRYGLIDVTGSYRNLSIVLWNDENASNQEIELSAILRRQYSPRVSYFFEGEYWKRFKGELPSGLHNSTAFAVGGILAL